MNRQKDRLSNKELREYYIQDKKAERKGVIFCGILPCVVYFMVFVFFLPGFWKLTGLFFLVVAILGIKRIQEANAIIKANEVKK